MNKLIIIGNGFDLAHGLPTSYGSFLNWIWKNFDKCLDEDIFKCLFNIDDRLFIPTNYNSYKEFYVKIVNERNPNYSIQSSDYGDKSFRIIYNEEYLAFEFKNKLFELITVNNVEKWVDIEKIYYDVLISIVNRDNKYRAIKNVQQLNNELKEIKELLENYLYTEVESKYNFKKDYSNFDVITDLFQYQFKDLLNKTDHEYFLEFPPDLRKYLTRFDNIFGSTSRTVYTNIFLDFNYTSNIQNYINVLSRKYKHKFGDSVHIQIHGKIYDDKNPINFGFGDEMDDHYKILENTADNDYLQNIKSFMYFNNSNYRMLLDWVESEVYQIYIMGHSCGLSDRTLLNTLFEHNNCKSIKIFYHQKDDGSDNFTELSQNISRHFNKKSLMREKVVNKSLSQPLPQDVIYNLL